MAFKKNKNKQFLGGNLALSFFILASLISPFLMPKNVLAVDGLLNGKTITGETDDFLLWLQTYDPNTSPYFFDKFFINKAGNVGIGTTTPSEKLEILGNLKVSGSIIASGISGITVSAPNVSSGAFAANTGGGNFSFPANVGIGTTAPGVKLQITQAADPNYPTLGTAKGAFFIAGDTNAYGLYTGVHTNTGNAWMQVMRNDGATAYNFLLQPVGGNVGIGTISPRVKLDISGSSPKLRLANDVQNAGEVGIEFSHSTYAGSGEVKDAIVTKPNGGYGRADMHFVVNNTGDSNGYTSGVDTKMIIKGDTGNVGIGTINPGAFRLNVVPAAGSNGVYITNVAGNYNSLLVDNNNADYKGVLINHTSLRGGGNCGGDGCYGFKFDDKRFNNLSAGYGPSFIITRSGTTTTSNLFQIDSHAVNGLTVADNANVGIGTTNPGSYKLYVNGNTNIAGSLNVTGTSTAAAFSGALAGTVNSSNVSSGEFGKNTGGGNFSFGATVPGNVGVGTATPNAKLSINNNIAFSIASLATAIDGRNAFRIRGRDTAVNTLVMGSSGANDYVIQNINDAGTGANSILINPFGGNVGVGMTDPLSRLNIVQSGTGFQAALRIENKTGVVNDATGIIFSTEAAAGGGKGGIAYSRTASWARGDLMFLQNSIANGSIADLSNAVMTIKNTGYVGIGTTAPSSKLTVSGGDLELDHNKSIKVSSATVNTTLLLGNYADGQAFAYGSTAPNKSASLAVEGDVKADRLCIEEDCKAAWSEIVTAGGGNQWITSGNNIYNSNSGNVGIGTNNPGAKLDITNNGGIIGRFTQTGSWTGSEWALYVTGYSNLGGYRFNAADGIRGIHKVDAGGIMGFSTVSDDPITFTQSNSLERMRIAAGGNVGIGTTTPVSTLHVNGTITANSFSGPLAGTVNAPNVSAGAFAANTGGGNFSFPGNLGIGTTGPVNKFDVIGKSRVGTYATPSTSYNEGLVIHNSGAENTSLMIWQNGVASAKIGFLANENKLRIANTYSDGSLSNTAAIILDSAGSVGIGTANPGVKLDVVGPVRTNSQFISTIATGAAPLAVTSNTLVANLNADLLDGQHYSDISNTIDSKISIAKSTNFGYRYAYDLWIYGETDKYYPFVIYGGDQDVKRDILIKRSYSETHPAEWNTATHGGGLTLKIKTNFGGWGGANYSWEIHELEEMYNSTFGGAQTVASYMGFATFLRGGGPGGAIYHVYSDQPIEGTHPVHVQSDGGSTGPFPVVYYNSEVVQYSTNPAYTWVMPAALTTPNTEDIRTRKFIPLTQSINSNITSLTNNYIPKRGGSYYFVNSLLFDNGSGVGIGTTNPGSYKLYVNGNTNIAGSLNVTGTSTAAAFSGALAGTVNSSNVSSGEFAKNTGGGNFIFGATVSGNVGVGTTNPISKFQVRGNSVFGNTVAASTIHNSNIINILSGDSGIASATGISFWEDSSSAMRLSYDGSGAGSSNALRIYDFNNNPLVSFQNGGNVGIGATVPDSKLHVLTGSASGPFTNISNFGSSRIHLSGSGDLNTSAAITTQIGSAGGTAIEFGRQGSSWGTKIAFYTNNDDTSSAGLIKQRMVIDKDGNVGIGTTAPSSKLTVSGGDLELDHNKSIKVSSATVNTTLLLGNYADGQAFAYGSTAPNKSASLAVEGDVKADRLCIEEDCKAAWSEIVSAGGGNQWITSGNNIYNSNSGNVGIGTAAPISKLDVLGSVPLLDTNTVDLLTISRPYNAGVRMGQSASFSLGGYDNSFHSYSKLDIKLRNADYSGTGSPIPDVTVMSLLSNGSVGIGTTTPGSYKLNVNGNTNITGTLNVTGTITGGAALTGTIIAANVSSGTFAANTGHGNFSLLGNFAIGTTTSSAKLNLYNNIAYNLSSLATAINPANAFRIRGRDTAAATLVMGSLNTSDYGIQAVNDAGTSGTIIALNPFGGNVGIGTTNPQHPLSIKSASSAATLQLIGRSDNYSNLVFTNADLTPNFLIEGGTNTFKLYSYNTSVYNPRLTVQLDGNVGIGTINPSEAKLVISAGTGMAIKAYGNGIFTGTLQTQTGSDFAEEFVASEYLEPGTVVVMGDLGYKSVKASHKSYDKTVVGIVSNNPSIIAGKVDSKQKAIVAMMGVVKVKVSDVNGKIYKGDMLTTSNISGYAMKADDSKQGTVIGKALENLTKKSGEINVLVNLQ